MGVALRNHDDETGNVYQLRPAQAGLFADNDVASRRIDPKRHVLKFKVRSDWDDGDVPLEQAVQLGLDDASVDRAQLAREATDGLPISDRECLRRELGSDASGHARAKFKSERDATVLALFHRFKRSEGYEQAVCSLFSVVSLDPTYMRDEPPSWILRLFCEEKRLLMETFCRDGDKRIELGDSEESEDEG
jgi:hypothetical protein